MSKTISSLELREKHISKATPNNNIIPFPRHHVQHKIDLPYPETEYSLGQQPHVMIVALGALIGGMIALFLIYHIDNILINITLFTALPFFLAFCMRKIYIHTYLKNMS